MKECDILGESKHTLTPPTYFQGVGNPNPHDLRPWSRIRFRPPNGGKSGISRLSRFCLILLTAHMSAYIHTYTRLHSCLKAYNHPPTCWCEAAVA